MNLAHTCLFHKVFCAVFFSNNEQNAGDITTQHTKKTCTFGTNEGKVKIKKQIPKYKVSLELLHHISVHLSRMSLFAGDTANIW